LRTVPGEGKGKTVLFRDGTKLTFDKDGKMVPTQVEPIDFSLTGTGKKAPAKVEKPAAAPAPAISGAFDPNNPEHIKAARTAMANQEADERRAAELKVSQDRLARSIDPEARKQMMRNPQPGDFYTTPDILGRNRIYYYDPSKKDATGQSGGWQSFNGYHPDMKHLAPTQLIKDLQNNKLLPNDDDAFYKTAPDDRGFIGKVFKNNPNYISVDKITGPKISVRSEPGDNDFGTPEWWKNPRNAPGYVDPNVKVKKGVFGDIVDLTPNDAAQMRKNTLASGDEVSDNLRRAGQQESFSTQLESLVEELLNEKVDPK